MKDKDKIRGGTWNQYAEFPETEKIVSMLEHKGEVFIATEYSIYQKVGDDFKRLNFVLENEET